MPERRPTHILSSYYAPRGHQRMYNLGQYLAQMYLSPTDKLIGVIGDAAPCPCWSRTEASPFSLPTPIIWISALKTASPR